MKALRFLFYYLLGLIRQRLFEISPSLYKSYYLNRVLTRAQKKYAYYSQVTKLSDVSLMNKNIFINNFDLLNTFALKYDNSLMRGLAQEQSRKFHQEPEGYTIGLSSGTSGKRGIFLTTENEQLKWAANLFTHLPWFSFLNKYRIGFILRANSPMYEKVSRSKRINFQFFDLMMPFNELITQFINYQPNVIVAPAYILNELVHYKTLNQEAFSEVKIIVSVADVLEPQVEQNLRALFKCPVHQIYQATEGFLATTCRYEKLHLNEDLLFFKEDIIDQSTNRFSPIITDYFRETQAIINYKLDDILVADPSPCQCGSKRRVISKIEGRSDEIITINGIKIFPDYIRNAVQNALSESIDFCVVKSGNAFTIKLDTISDLKLEQKILQNFQNLYTDNQITNMSTVVEFNFKRDFSMKRRRVFSEDA